MAELSTVARPYAEALFAVARDSGESLAGWLAAVDDLAALMTHPQVAEVVADPNLDHAQVFSLLTGMMKAPLPAAGSNFLKLLIENQRLAVLPQVALQFRQLKNHAEGVADCLIESAFPISDAQVAELLASLAKKFGQQAQAGSSGECEPDRRCPRHGGRPGARRFGARAPHRHADGAHRRLKSSELKDATQSQ